MSDKSLPDKPRIPTGKTSAAGRQRSSDAPVGVEKTLPAAAGAIVTESIALGKTEKLAIIDDVPATGSTVQGSPAEKDSVDGDSAAGTSLDDGSGAGTDSTKQGSQPGFQALATLRQAEIDRSRSFFQIILLFGPLIALSVFALPGDQGAKLLLVAAIVLFVAVSVPAYLTLRNNEPASELRLGASGITGVTAVYCGHYYFGLLSLAGMVTVLGLYFFSMAGTARTNKIIFLTAASEHALLATLSVTGTLPEVGLVRPFDMSVGQQLLIHLLAEIILLQTFVLSRASLRSQINLMNELESAVRARAVARREAILEEAHQELHRAGLLFGDGRFTDQILGSFRLGSLIGRGAMGEVYAASRDGDSEGVEDYAVKVMVRAALSSPEHVRRFLREGELISKIRSPHVVRVFQVGGGDGRLPFIAMQRLYGKDLSTILREQEILSLPRCTKLVQHLAKGLGQAHSLGIVHRDLKPLNVFRDGRGAAATWKLLDFGVAKGEYMDDSLTGDKLVGTPAYMAPEQARSLEVDHRADIYALAAVMYRATTGMAPFRGANTPEILLAVTSTMPKQPSTLRGLPYELDAVFAIALAKNPEDRFDSAEEFAAAYARAARRSLRSDYEERAARILTATPWSV